MTQSNNPPQAATGVKSARSVVHDADLREALAMSRAAADKRAPAMHEGVARSAQNWLRGNRVLEAAPPADGIYYLSTADRISVTPGFEFYTQNTGPWDNWAEVAFDRRAPSSGASWDGQVTFSFSWQHPTGQVTMIRVTGLLGVIANCIVTADGYRFPYWLPPYRWPPSSVLNAYAELRITVVEEDGHTFEPPYTPDQIQDILHQLSVRGSWSSGTIDSQDVFRTYVLQHLDLLVPENGKVQFDLSCNVSWFANSGGGYFIAADRGRKVTGWGVIIKSVPWIMT